jgi:serine/threonine protein kinase
VLAGGTRFGPYEIVSAIGAGGMGQVYKARDTRLGREVAIKVLHGDVAQMADRLARFEQEARAVAALNHPNVLALHDFGYEAGVAYVVTELLEGETLRARLRAAGRLTPRKVLDYTNQIVRGLAAAHERGIVHRDLKPENLFITHEGRIKILDFGLAYQEEPAGTDDLAATRLTTEQGMVMGTLGYIAPEQVLGQGTTTRSDLFALGVITYEALTGVQPFRRPTIAETMAATLRDEPPPLQRELPDVPATLANLVERCLEKNPADRPASTHDLALFLEAVAAEVNDPGGAPRKRSRNDHLLRNQIIAAWCSLWLLLTVAMWSYVRSMGGDAAAAIVDSDLARAERLVASVHRERLNQVLLTARLVASFPELRALFATDAATLRDYLLSYQQRNPDAPSLLAISADGKLIARTQEGDDAIVDAVGSLAAGKAAIVRSGDTFFHAALSMAEVGGTEFGSVVARMPVDQLFAVALREATQDEIVVITDSSVITSTMPASRLPWRSAAEWRQLGGQSNRAIDVMVGDERFAAREIPLSEQPPLSVVVLKSRAGAVAPYQRIQDGVAIIGALGLIVVAAASFWLAHALRAA